MIALITLLILPVFWVNNRLVSSTTFTGITIGSILANKRIEFRFIRGVIYWKLELFIKLCYNLYIQTVIELAVVHGKIES
jgi:hypothetical protein